MNREARQIEVFFTPENSKSAAISENAVVVVVDVLRASTTICAALHSGVKRVWPVLHEKEAKRLHEKGYKVAGERQGVKLEFADYGNSPLGFEASGVIEELVLTTTNGTRAIHSVSGSHTLIVGSFCNLQKVAGFLRRKTNNIVILCAGWNGGFSMEDTLYAGALSQLILEDRSIEPTSDTVLAARVLWEKAKTDVVAFVSQTHHYRRLAKLGHSRDLEFCFEKDTLQVIPFLKNNYLIDINNTN